MERCFREVDRAKDVRQARINATLSFTVKACGFLAKPQIFSSLVLMSCSVLPSSLAVFFPKLKGIEFSHLQLDVHTLFRADASSGESVDL